MGDIGAAYSPLDGFTLLNDVRGPIAFANINGSGRGNSRLKTIHGFVTADRFFKHDGTLHSVDDQAQLDLNFKPQLQVSASITNSQLNDPVLTGNVWERFNQAQLTLHYGDGTSSPIDLSYAVGPFGRFYLHQYTALASKNLSNRIGVSIESDGTREDAFGGGDSSQTLSRIGLNESLGSDSNLTVSLRWIRGTGGFAEPGLNVAGAYHIRFHSGNELFVNYGTPAAPATLNRLIAKYVFHVGGGAGT